MPQANAIIAAVLVALGFVTGWITNGWRHSSVELAARVAADQAAKASADQIAKVATDLEAKLSERQITERVIDRGVIKEIRKNETVYRNVCITDDGRMLINQAAKGRIAGEPDR